MCDTPHRLCGGPAGTGDHAQPGTELPTLLLELPVVLKHLLVTVLVVVMLLLLAMERAAVSMMQE